MRVVLRRPGNVRLRPLNPPPADTPAVLETSQDFGGTGGREKAGFLPSIQKPASTRKIRPDGLTRRISAFSRDGLPPLPLARHSSEKRASW